jgi:hypothetical protein
VVNRAGTILVLGIGYHWILPSNDSIGISRYFLWYSSTILRVAHTGKMQSACTVGIFTKAFVAASLNWVADIVAASDDTAVSMYLLLTILHIAE